MAPATILGELAPVIIAVTAAGGLCGGIVALLRVRPEAGKLVVEAAEGAVVVQSGVITSLREELGKVREGLELELVRRASCEERLDACELELEHVRRVLERHGLNGVAAGRPGGAPPSGPQTTS